MIDKIIDYFDLHLFREDLLDLSVEPVLGKSRREELEKARKRKEIIWTFVLYLGVILGVVGQQFLNNMTDFSRFTIIASVILGTVVFPQVYKQAKLDAEKPNIMQFFIAFQNGFFWQNLMTILTKLMQET